ncbi:unnamed protein product, partial [Adineta ricciae]
MVNSIACIIFSLSAESSGMLFNRFQGELDGNQIIVDAYNNPQLINEFTRRLGAIIRGMPNSEISTPFCELLNEAFESIESHNNGHEESCERLAVMITDGSIRFGADRDQLTREFRRYG